MKRKTTRVGGHGGRRTVAVRDGSRDCLIAEEHVERSLARQPFSRRLAAWLHQQAVLCRVAG